MRWIQRRCIQRRWISPRAAAASSSATWTATGSGKATRSTIQRRANSEPPDSCSTSTSSAATTRPGKSSRHFPKIDSIFKLRPRLLEVDKKWIYTPPAGDEWYM